MHRDRTHNGSYIGHIFDECSLIKNGNNVIIELYRYHRDYDPFMTVYRVNSNGTIEFLYDKSKEDYEDYDNISRLNYY
jgi:hypothetical protein